MAEAGWTYRLVRRVVEGVEVFAVHEAYYDAAGKVWSITEGPVEACAPTRDETLLCLATMLADCLEHPVLDFDQIPEPGAEPPADMAHTPATAPNPSQNPEPKPGAPT